MTKKEKEIKIRFFHSIGKNSRPSTTAILNIGEDRYIGTATLYVKDKFSKAEGRKFSLQKAMEIAKLSKVDRTSVWDNYTNSLNVSD